MTKSLTVTSNREQLLVISYLHIHAILYRSLNVLHMVKFQLIEFNKGVFCSRYIKDIRQKKKRHFAQFVQLLCASALTWRFGGDLRDLALISRCSEQKLQNYSGCSVIVFAYCVFTWYIVCFVT